MLHILGEENSIYKHLVEEVAVAKAFELTTLSNKEHHQIKEYLQTLNLLRMDTKEWSYTFHQMKLFVQKHCVQEEQEMFNEVKEDFSKEELVEIASEFLEARHLQP